MRRADFHLFKMTAWALACWVVAEFAVKLESVFRYGQTLTTEQLLFTGAPPNTNAQSYNMLAFTPESFLVNAFVGVAIVSGLMFLRETLSFQKYLRSLSYMSDIKPFGENPKGVSV